MLNAASNWCWDRHSKRTLWQMQAALSESFSLPEPSAHGGGQCQENILKMHLVSRRVLVLGGIWLGAMAFPGGERGIGGDALAFPAVANSGTDGPDWSALSTSIPGDGGRVSLGSSTSGVASLSETEPSNVRPSLSSPDSSSWRTRQARDDKVSIASTKDRRRSGSLDSRR